MDSSRSGLLSTLIMTVPLIVVPAIALLRPAIQSPGFSTSPLSASSDDDDDLLSEFEFDDFDSNSFGNRDQSPGKSKNSASDQDYYDWFDEKIEPEVIPDAGRPTTPNSPSDRQPPGFSPDPFEAVPPEQKSNVPHTGPTPGHATAPGHGTVPKQPNPVIPGSNSPLPASPGSPANEAEWLKQLQAMGVSRTMWFSSGRPGQFGFAAFLPGKTPEISYRFEAIAVSRAEAVRRVSEQIRSWRPAARSGSR